MPITIHGDMTQEQVDDAMIENLRAMLASSSSGGMFTISYRQAIRLLELAEAGRSGPGQGQGQGPPGKD